MARGRRRKPEELKEAQGRPGKRPPVSVEALDRFGAAVTDAPGWLQGLALEIWKAEAPALAATNLLRRTDRQTFALFCQALANYIEATGKLCGTDEDAGEGKVYLAKSEHNPDGLWRLSPWNRLQEKAFQQIKDLAPLFGITPAGRIQLLAQLSRREGIPDLPAGKPADDHRPAAESDDTPFGFFDTGGGGPSTAH